MPFLEYQQQIELTAGGGTANLPVAESYKAYSVVSTGSVTLLANWTIQASGTPIAGHKYFLITMLTLLLTVMISTFSVQIYLKT